MSKGGGRSAPSPDPLIGESALKNAQLAKEALDWYKQQYANGQGDRDAAARIANDTARQQMDIAAANQAISKDYHDYQKGTFRPLEQALVADAQNYDTAQRRENEAGQAIADTRTAFDQQRQQMKLNAMANGINPNSGHYLSQQQKMGVSEAASAAAAGNSARKNVEIQGYARKMDVANLGRNLASNQATSAGVALNAGNSAVSSGQVPSMLSHRAGSLAGQGYQAAMQGNQSAGNLATNSYNAQLQHYGLKQNAQNGMMGALGSLGGSVIGALWSSKKLKHSKRQVGAKEALQGINNLNIEKWKYKDGVADEGEHIGPYAEDVQRELGDAVAPGGDRLNINEMFQKNVEALQALTQKADALEAKLKGRKG